MPDNAPETDRSARPSPRLADVWGKAKPAKARKASPLPNPFRQIWAHIRSRIVLRYTAAITAIITASVVLLGGFFFFQFREISVQMDLATQDIIETKLQDRDRVFGRALAFRAQDYLLQPLADGDRDAVQASIRAFKDELNLDTLSVFDASGRLIPLESSETFSEAGIEEGMAREAGVGAATVPQTLTVEEDDIQVTLDRVRVDGSLEADGAVVGYYTLARSISSTSEMLSYIQDASLEARGINSRRILKAVLLAGAFAIALGTFAAIRIARRLSRPIQQLVEETGHISREEFGRELRIDHYDEIGDLFAAFNEMSRNLAAGREAQRKAAHSELARVEAEQSSKAKSQFLANMSHEIRTPMNGVLGMAQLLSMDDLTAAQKQQVDIIMRSGEALMTVINDILDFSKLQSGQLRLEPLPFVLRDTVDDVMALLGHTARAKGVELIGDMPIGVQSSVVGDEGRVRQILLNLVGNALKFTEAGHVRLAVSCEETARGPEGPTAVRLRFDIEDTGIGIAPDKLATIFNQFEQADNTTTRRFGGTGLGLSISRQLAEAMGGTITVASIVGNGSVFSFQVDMPVADVSVSAKSEPTLGLPSGTPILVVDDHEATRAVLAEQLERFGAKPVCVPSASAALSAMKRAHDVHNFRFPLVVTDHDMPGLTGLDLVERVRATPELHDTPFVIATTSPSNLIADAYARLGVVDILEKPYPTQRMTEVVLNHLAETQLSALKTIAQTQPAAAAATQVPLRRSA